MATTPANSVNETTTGVCGFTGTAFTSTPVTAHNVIIGGSTSSTLVNVAPSATSGVAIISQGASADPVFGTVVVAGGGTGAVTLTGVLTGNGTSAITASTITQNGVIVGGASNAVTSTGVGSTGQVLQGVSASAPTYSTATYPSVATGTGTILRADGTNWSATTSTYPNTNAINTLLYASSANVMAALATAANSVVLTDASSVPSLGTSLLNDFTYTSSTAGTLRTLTVSNTNNSNTSSRALIQTTVGGASAGDPFHTFTVTGATSWSQGIDNSVSDNFVISASTALGTTNVMSATTSGQINYPLQPAFLAEATLQSNVTGDATAYTAIFSSEVFDQGSDYNASTGVFTAPVTGRYSLSASVAFLGLGAANTTGTWNFNASNRQFITSQSSYGAERNAGNVFEDSGACFADMDAADTVSVDLAVSGGTKVVDIGGASYFGGYLAC